MMRDRSIHVMSDFSASIVYGEVNIKDALPQAVSEGTTLTMVMRVFLDGISWSFHINGTLLHRQQGSQGLWCFAP